MPGKMQFLNIIAIALQYSLVLLIYYFLYRVVNIASKDLTKLTIAPQSPLSLQLQPGGSTEGNQVPRLVVIDDEKALLSLAMYPIAENLAIGRSQNNDLVINDTFVSHEHACISKSKQTYLIADLSSTNGTLLNGQRIVEETALVDGDVIQIGAVTLKFER